MGRQNGIDRAAALRIGPGPMTDALRALRDRERLLLGAYMHFEARDGARVGQPGVCWPSDLEVAAYLGRSAATVRRSRTVLATMATPWIALRYVAPFGALPDGTTSAHGANVVMLLQVGAPEEAPLVDELVDATTALRRLERDLQKARAKVDALREQVHQVRDQAAANDDGGSSHNAPSVLTTPAWSPRKAVVREREGESPATAVSW